MNSQPLSVRLAQSFGTKPVRKPLLELIDELIDTNLEGLQADRFEDQLAAAQRADRIHEDIARRIEELESPAAGFERELREVFGDEAARIDHAAREASGVDPVAAVQKAIEGRA